MYCYVAITFSNLAVTLDVRPLPKKYSFGFRKSRKSKFLFNRKIEKKARKRHAASK